MGEMQKAVQGQVRRRRQGLLYSQRLIDVQAYPLLVEGLRSGSRLSEAVQV